MILSAQEIERRCTNGENLVVPYNANSLRRSSYDLTVGLEFYCGDHGDTKSHTVKVEQLPTSATFSIPANGVCFLLCTETITLPSDITARVALRMPFIYRGLVLTAQPPFDPGYSGMVIVMLHNLSSQAIQLTQAERIATIEFSEVSHPTAQTAPHRPVTSLISQLRGPLTGSLVKMQHQVKAARSAVNTFMLQLGTIIAALIAIPAVAGFISYGAISEKISTMQTKIDDSEKIIRKQQETVDDLYKIIRQKDAAEKISVKSQNIKNEDKR